MATLQCSIRLESMDGERSVQLDALVDTDSFFTTVPASLLRELELVPTEEIELELADRGRVVRQIGDARVTVDGRSTATLVVFGEEDTDPVLGRYALTGLRLELDSAEETLVSVRFLRA